MSEFLSEAEVAELERIHADAALAWNRGFVSSVSGARFADAVLGGNALPRLLAERRALREALEMLVKIIDHANDGAFENGVRVEGSADEGEVLTSRRVEEARALLAPQKESP